MSYEEYAPWLPKGERAMSDESYKWERDARANNAEAQVLFERARADAAEARVAAYEQRLRGWACDVCWTMSWAPCPPNTPNAIPDPQSASGEWMICQMCERDAAIRQERAQRDRLAAALDVAEDAMYSAGWGDEQGTALAIARAVLADVPDYTARLNAQTGYDLTDEQRRALYPLPHDFADVGGHQDGHSVPAAESTADTDTLLDSTNAMPSGKPIMPTLTDEEHAAVGRTLSHTHEARQARKRDEAYRAMVTFCRVLDTRVARAALMVAGIHLPDELDRALALARQAEEG